MSGISIITKKGQADVLKNQLKIQNLAFKIHNYHSSPNSQVNLYVLYPEPCALSLLPMLTIREYTKADKNAWDTYVRSHPDATLYHLSGWKNVIEKTYNPKSYYLMALRPVPCAMSPSSNGDKLQLWESERLDSKKQLEVKHSHLPNVPASQYRAGNITGILPLVHLKHFLFGNSLISVPFFDYGGILADDQETEIALLNEAIKLTKNIGATSIELRQINPINSLESQIQNSGFKIKNFNIVTHSHKVRMLIELPESSGELMKSFKSKLRSQIRRPIKEGLTAAIGGVDLLDDFYRVFSINMRDLGSPVHSKRLLQNVLYEFSDKSRIVIIYKEELPMACSMIIGFKDTLDNPWASSLREFSSLAPNMLLYWTMLEYGCDNGYNKFDFGRSTSGEGTYKFKEQWGAIPQRLHWQYVSFAKERIENGKSSKDKYRKFVLLWKNLPVPITKIIGPPIRKYIGL